MSPLMSPLARLAVAFMVSVVLAIVVGWLERRAFDRRKAAAARSRMVSPATKPRLRR
jgi:hypothetical protein